MKDSVIRNHREIIIETTDERMYRENCTFKPVIEFDCPFVSERTLRDYAIKSRKRRPPPPPSSRNLNNSSRSRSPLKRKSNNDSKYQKLMEVVESTTSMGGMYDTDLGFRKGPPLETGLQIYYFDAENPPEFDDGKYLVRLESLESSINDNMIEEYEEQEVIDEESNKDELLPPPLPLDVDGSDSGSKGVMKPIVLKIIKSNKEKADNPGLTGWQAVMAEMQKKKEAMFGGGGLKKVEIIDNSNRKVKQNKKKKKKGEFKDVMDELSYKLAKLRGEIAESEDEDEDTPDVIPITTSNDNKQTSTIINDNIEETSNKSLNRLPSKKNMMDLLSGITKPKGSDKDNEKVQTTNPIVKTPTAVLAGKLTNKDIQGGVGSSQVSLSEKAPIAISRPSIVPAPPPLPSAWPPLPYLIVEPEISTIELKKEANQIKMKTIRVLVKKPAPLQQITVYKDELQDLPKGYYMPAPVVGMVGNKQILPGSLTTVEQCESMKLLFLEIAESKKTQLYNDSTYGTIELKNDSSYYDDEDDNNDDKYSNDYELDVEKLMKNKLTISDLPLPPDFYSAVHRLQRSTEIRHKIKEKEKHLELRNFLYYETIFDKNVHTAAMELATKKLEITIPKSFKSHVDELNESKSFSHRKPTDHSSIDMLPRSQRIPDTISSAYSATVSLGLSPCDVYWMQNLRSPDKSSLINTTTASNNIPNKSLLSTIQSNKSYNDTATYNTDINQKELSSGAKYFSNYRPNTETKCFKLLSNEIIERRKKDKELKEIEFKKLEYINNEKLKKKKEKMKLNAMKQAQITGSYKSPIRYNYHQKILDKYNLQPEIGSINLKKDIKSAYEQYTISHNLISHENDLLNNNNIMNKKQQYNLNKDYRYILDLQKEFNDYQYDGEQIDFNKKYLNS